MCLHPKAWPQNWLSRSAKRTEGSERVAQRHDCRGDVGLRVRARRRSGCFGLMLLLLLLVERRELRTGEPVNGEPGGKSVSWVLGEASHASGPHALPRCRGQQQARCSRGSVPAGSAARPQLRDGPPARLRRPQAGCGRERRRPSRVRGDGARTTDRAHRSLPHWLLGAPRCAAAASGDGTGVPVRARLREAAATESAIRP